MQLRVTELRCGIGAGTGCRTGNYSYASKQGSSSSALRRLSPLNTCRPAFTEQVLCHSVEEQAFFVTGFMFMGVNESTTWPVPSGWF